MATDVTGTQKEKKDKIKTKRDRLAAYLYTMSQVTFGTMVLAVLPSLVADEINWYSLILFFFGLMVTYIFAFFANRILSY